MRIGDLAAQSGVSTRVIRYYQEQGLLDPARTPAGQRVFPESAVDRVGFIRQLLAAGLPTRTIVDILPCMETGGISAAQHELLVTEFDRIDRQIQALAVARDRLADVIAHAPVAPSEAASLA